MESLYVIALVYFVLNFTLEQISLAVDSGRGQRRSA
jgi:hypothetical protein